jgi:hypothetical protein
MCDGSFITDHCSPCNRRDTPASLSNAGEHATDLVVDDVPNNIFSYALGTTTAPHPS